MARRRKKNNGKFQKYFKVTILGIFILTIVFFVYNRGLYLLKTSDIFRIREVVRDSSLQFIQSKHLDRLKGKNIFSIRLDKIETQLKRQYPQVQELKVSKRFPGRIVIVAKKRKPFAYITDGGKDIVIDEDGFVMSRGDGEVDGLPYIEGFKKIEKIVPGLRLRTRGLGIAVEIIQQFNKNEYLSKYSAASVDVRNLSKINLYTKGGLHVMLDRYEVNKKINKLGLVLSLGNIKTKDMQYVDLRFKEPIIGTKK